MGDTSTNFEIDDPGGGARIAGVAGSPGAAADTVLTSDGAGGTSWASGGGSVPGAARVLGPFPIAFDDAGLADGIAFYTPTVGDILFEVWLEIVTAWNGTTPLADVGTAVGADHGIFDASGGVLSLTDAAAEYAGTGVLLSTGTSGAQVGGVVPGRFTATNPLKVWVSQDGFAGGDDPGASQGAANVYLVVSTPDAP